ncbi:DNA ligase [Thiobaca trueperi]|uniref:DNA ligase-1 n=1 Tax=Thiobaca trueperi TaxID=127458 RepID=A0A4R3MSZ2_9GAMM|nr:DNA ligase [Thiobaca trueperi]TCT18201.1 DNA ligase-1 [Thiobaca trueperi]
MDTPGLPFRRSFWILPLLCLIALPGAAESPGLSAVVQDATQTPQINPASSGKPALMLANTYQEGIDLSVYWVSEKLDGVRAYWNGKRLVSRGGNPIQSPDWFTAGFPSEPLDGELWMGRGTFERLSGAVRRQTPDPDVWRTVRFMVFDLPGVDAPFGQRLQSLRRILAGSPSHYLAPVEQFRVADHAELMARLDAVVAAGGEGLMLHRDGSSYRAGRTNDLLKVKPYQDAEARVIGHLPGQGKYAGMLGALLVEDREGRRFRLGSGFTDAQRRDPPSVGSLVTFKYRGYTNKGTPRFASFLRVRAEE